jgi:hypothetical protein
MFSYFQVSDILGAVQQDAVDEGRGEQGWLQLQAVLHDVTQEKDS